ncbi:hypothetical protein BDR04DRAFT_1157151, partial [Suillus decipiens]
SSGSTGEPITVVIDALDESGGVETREDLLLILAGKHPAVPKITDLPGNFRFIVTSRALYDIKKEFDGVQHIRQISMDDIPPAFAERDIRTYVSKELQELAFQAREFGVLAEKADGLFEWARLACEYIKQSQAGLSQMDCYEAVVSRDPAERRMLLHRMYDLILTGIIPKDPSPQSQKMRLTALARFRSVMRQILGMTEPLPLASLNAMRRHFPTQEDNFNVELVVKSMGSLLSGTTNPDSPIRPLHASFHDFLTDERASGEFFIDLSKARQDLAFASLRVMEHDLRFNICDLESSYLPNDKDPGLQGRIKKRIPPHLSYSCQFWIWHVRTTAFTKELAKEVKSFFDHERLFFWLESLALINVNALSSAVHALSHIPRWLKGYPKFIDVSSTAMDVQKFIQVFGGIVSHSTPHLYVSALPFTPSNSPLSRNFHALFPNTLRVALGRHMNWPAVLAELMGHTDSVLSVSFSPDGTRIVTGSQDQTVRLWDAATGQPVGEPLRGHTEEVSSVSFSPDGTRIVSGSWDQTVRLWDAATGQPVGEPLRGHTSRVWSVSFSPDGTRIVSGLRDQTVRLWDAATGQPVGEPLRGHTNLVWSVWFSPDGTRIASGSSDQTIRLWYAAMKQPSQQYAVSDPAPLSDEHRTIEVTTTTTLNTWNNHLISFSTDEFVDEASHEIMEEVSDEFEEEASDNDRIFTPIVLNVDSGWVVGPKGWLLFWVPLASRHPFYNPGTSLVIPRGGTELDLSHMAHGQHWQKCREGNDDPCSGPNDRLDSNASRLCLLALFSVTLTISGDHFPSFPSTSRPNIISAKAFPLNPACTIPEFPAANRSLGGAPTSPHPYVTFHNRTQQRLTPRYHTRQTAIGQPRVSNPPKCPKSHLSLSFNLPAGFPKNSKFWRGTLLLIGDSGPRESRHLGTLAPVINAINFTDNNVPSVWRIHEHATLTIIASREESTPTPYNVSLLPPFKDQTQSSPSHDILSTPTARLHLRAQAHITSSPSFNPISFLGGDTFAIDIDVFDMLAEEEMIEVLVKQGEGLSDDTFRRCWLSRSSPTPQPSPPVVAVNGVFVAPVPAAPVHVLRIVKRPKPHDRTTSVSSVSGVRRPPPGLMPAGSKANMFCKPEQGTKYKLTSVLSLHTKATEPPRSPLETYLLTSTSNKIIERDAQIKVAEAWRVVAYRTLLLYQRACTRHRPLRL